MTRDFRGKIYTIDIAPSIKINGQTISRAIIELDHINYGLNKRTGKLNKKKRLNFNLKDIKQFIMLLDDEDLPVYKHQGHWRLFVLRIDSPVKNKFKGKEFIMIFKLNTNKKETIYTITLYPGWK